MAVVDWALQSEALVRATLPQALDAHWQDGPAFRRAVAHKLDSSPHGRLAEWWVAFERLRSLPQGDVDLAQVAPQVNNGRNWDASAASAARAALLALGPWRKGPFALGPLLLDAEWRCDLKWARVGQAVDFGGKRVLDVGSGNGYACLRALGAGARFVLGVDPTLLYVMQFLALSAAMPGRAVAVAPLALEDMPERYEPFDVTLSMGVLYHRRSPIDHLLDLKRTLRPGGELVLDTLVVPGPAGYSLMPADRYASMRNVWFVPSPDTVLVWLARAGFRDIELVDQTVTTSDEQRSTEWMAQLSLRDFLDPGDSAKTLEGYPAPCRALFRARRV